MVETASNNDGSTDKQSDTDPQEAASARQSGGGPTIPPGAKDSIRRAGTAAGQGLLGVVVFSIIFVITGALGFLVLRGAIEPGPFLLAIGILLGFFLGHINAVSS